MTILEVLLRPTRHRCSPARPPAWRPSPEVEGCRREIYRVVAEFLGRSNPPIMAFAGQESCRLGDSGVYRVGPFTVGGHGWVYHQDGCFSFALNTAGHWSYVGRYGVRADDGTEVVALWTVSMGRWPSLDQGGTVCVANAGWASPGHVVQAAKAAVAEWQSR